MNKTSRLLTILVATLVLAACGLGGGSSKSPESPSSAKTNLSPQVASYDLALGGPQRFIIGVLTNDHRLVGHGSITLRFAFLGTKEEGAAKVVGEPVTAHFLPIPTDSGSSPPEIKNQPEILEGLESNGVYSVNVAFDRAGFWGAQVFANIKGLGTSTGDATFGVLEKNLVTAVGQDAPRTENHTISSTDIPPKGLDSRAESIDKIPDPELHKQTVAGSIAAKRPVLLVISTPVYCVSRFCGPITDMVSVLAKKYPDRANFIHIEVWRDFENKQINKAAADWIYKNDDATEPWVFLIGADGKVAARWDNVATAQEIEPLLQGLPSA